MTTQFPIYSIRQAPYSITALSEALQEFLPNKEIVEFKRRIRRQKNWHERWFENKYVRKILWITLLTYQYHKRINEILNNFVNEKYKKILT